MVVLIMHGVCVQATAAIDADVMRAHSDPHFFDAIYTYFLRPQSTLIQCSGTIGKELQGSPRHGRWCVQGGNALKPSNRRDGS